MRHPPEPEEAPDNCAAHLSRSWLAYLQGDCATGLSAAQAALQEDAQRGDVWYLLALNWERQGLLAQADRAYRRAQGAPEYPQAAPYRITWQRFERWVEVCADSLPNKLRQALEAHHLLLHNYAPGSRCTADLHETLFLHQGPTHSQIKHSPQPAEIHLYRRPHEHCSRSARNFQEQLRISLISALGTFLEYSEAAIAHIISDPG